MFSIPANLRTHGLTTMGHTVNISWIRSKCVKSQYSCIVGYINSECKIDGVWILSAYSNICIVQFTLKFAVNQLWC